MNVAPDFSLTDVDGNTVSLYHILDAGQSVILVFLRHLGCLVCAEHVAQLCRHKKELRELNAVVLVVSFGTQKEAKAWLEETCPSFQLLLDPDRDVYHAYKVGHSWSRSWNIKTLAYYVRALVGGRNWHGIKGDPAQLGGDFIINPDRTFELAHPSKEATDRPEVSYMLNILRKKLHRES